MENLCCELSLILEIVIINDDRKGVSSFDTKWTVNLL